MLVRQDFVRCSTRFPNRVRWLARAYEELCAGCRTRLENRVLGIAKS